MKRILYLIGFGLVCAPAFGAARLCDQSPGATAGAKIAACISELPAAGGTADASGLQGEQTISTNIFENLTKPVDLILCGADYRITVNLTISFASQLHIHGCATKSATLSFSGTAIGILISESSDVEIDHLKLRGGATQIHAAGSSNLYFHDLDLSGATILSPNILAAIDIEDCDDVTIERNHISGNGTATTAQGAFDIVNGETTTNVSNRVHVRNNTIIGSTISINIALFNCNDCDVTGNYIDNNNQMHRGGACSNCSGYGILFYATGPAPLVVTGGLVAANHVVNTAGSAIYLVSMKRMIVSNNIVERAAKQQADVTLPVGGISINGASDVSVTGNQLSTSGRDCIVAIDAIGMSITGNTCKSFARAGVRLGGMTAKTSVTGNTLIDGERGVYADSVSSLSHVVVTGNTISNMSQEGMAFNAPLTDGIISGNSMDTVISHGLLALRALRGTVTANTFNMVQGPAIDWRGNSATFTGNVISAATGYGFDITGNQSTITGNHVTASLRGVSINGSYAIVENNNFAGNTDTGNRFANATSFGRGNRFTTDAMQGIVMMTKGSAKINTAEYLGSSDLVFITRMGFDPNNHNGHLAVRFLGVGSFTIDSDDPADGGTVMWEIVH